MLLLWGAQVESCGAIVCEYDKKVCVYDKEACVYDKNVWVYDTAACVYEKKEFHRKESVFNCDEILFVFGLSRLCRAQIDLECPYEAP